MTKWTEAEIRKEISRLDTITGLHGNTLPIRFNRAKTCLGSFDSRNGGLFTFSNAYFQNPDCPDEIVLDVIRHEYAHYMDFEVYGNMGHKETWKICCGIVGAQPTTYYERRFTKYYQKKRRTETDRSERLDVWKVGMTIGHPNYGTGVITEISGDGLRRTATVDFADVGTKKLGLEWIDRNCVIVFMTTGK